MSIDYKHYPWIYEGLSYEEAPPDKIGFVYCITNKDSGMKYIGQKKFWSIQRKKIKGKVKRIKFESDWREYFGSSKKLLEEIINHGYERYLREILFICDSKAHMNYLELKEQLDRNVLFSDLYYNDFVGTKIHRKHISTLEKIQH